MAAGKGAGAGTEGGLEELGVDAVDRCRGGWHGGGGPGEVAEDGVQRAAGGAGEEERGQGRADVPRVSEWNLLLVLLLLLLLLLHNLVGLVEEKKFF